MRLALARRFVALPALALALQGCADIPPGWMLLQRQSAITDHRHFANAPIARPADASPLPSALDALVHLPQRPGYTFNQLMEQNGTVAIVIVKHGQIVLERYYKGYQRDSMATSFSVAKSVVSALVGIAIDNGSIGSVDDPITRYVPELDKRDARFGKITIRDLLAMRSGIAFDEGYLSPLDDAARFYLTPDLLSKVLGLRIREPANQTMRYSSGDTQLLGLIVQRATGTPLPRYAQEKIWKPMGAAFDASWSIDSEQSVLAKAFCCLNARAVDYARFGLVYLNQGKFNDRQIVPAQWVRDSTEVRSYPGADAASRSNLESQGTLGAAFYTWQWRRAKEPDQSELGVKPRSDFYAQGLHGQVVYVAPEQDMVIVRLGTGTGTIWWPGFASAIARLNP